MAEKTKDRPTFIEEARRKQIIESTIQTLAEKGFVNTSLADIADQIGVSKGVISYHFNGKDELINATLDWIIETLVTLRQQRMDAEQTPAKKLRAYFWANAEFIKSNPGYIPAQLELWASYSTTEAKLYFNHRAYEPCRTQLDIVFRIGQETGEFQQFDRLMMASLIQGAIDGVMFQWYFNPARIDVDDSMRELIKIFELSILINNESS